jgi:hypothetical protein
VNGLTNFCLALESFGAADIDADFPNLLKGRIFLLIQNVVARDVGTFAVFFDAGL